MDLIFIDFIYITAGIFIMKLGYLVLFNNLLFIMSLQGKRAENNYLENFGGLLGKVLFVIGLLTSLLSVGRRYFPNYYLIAYFFIIIICSILLTIRFFMLREESKIKGENDGE